MNRPIPAYVRVAALVVLGSIVAWRWYQGQKELNQGPNEAANAPVANGPKPLGPPKDQNDPESPNDPPKRDGTREQPVRQAPKERDEHPVAGPAINMDHILRGGINRQGNLVGLHHLPSAPKELLVEGKKCRVEFKQTSPGGPDDVR